MVLARHLEERLERTRQARRSEGRVETQKKWEAWNVRRLEAESKGLPFTEPPPSMPTE